MFHNLAELMHRGKPVAVILTSEVGKKYDLLYCELILRARFGESFNIESQGCRAGAYVLGELDTSPEEYYYRSGRYRDRNTAKYAVQSLHRLKTKHGTIKVTPYSGGDFDVLILFLKPERAMRLVQAYAYQRGYPLEIITGGIASVCSECTAYPMEGMPGVSLGCKGSRKHSRYLDDELVVGIPFRLAEELDEALARMPETFA
jgi:uncharacterized protein (DUF169 family)